MELSTCSESRSLFGKCGIVKTQAQTRFLWPRTDSFKTIFKLKEFTSFMSDHMLTETQVEIICRKETTLWRCGFNVNTQGFKSSASASFYPEY